MTDVLHLVRASVLIFQGISADFPSFSLIAQPTTTIPPLQTRPTPLHIMHASVFVSGPSSGSVFQPTSQFVLDSINPLQIYPLPDMADASAYHARVGSCLWTSLRLAPSIFQTCGTAFFPVTERSESSQHEFECSSPRAAIVVAMARARCCPHDGVGAMAYARWRGCDAVGAMVRWRNGMGAMV